MGVLKNAGEIARKDWVTLSIFGLATFFLYQPILHNSFLTDDYASLYRICVAKEILHKDIFRPLIDISFYFNYLLSGLHPEGYYIFNLCVHALTAFMTYKVALALPFFKDDRQYHFARMAGILFLVYPVHNESIVWLAGRLSSMAALCGLTAVYFSLKKAAPWNIILPAVFLIIGLFAYESIGMLPMIIIVLGLYRYAGKKKLLRSIAAWSVVLAICLLIRYLFGGAMFPQYGKGVFVSEEGNGHLVRLFKALGRCFLPPMEASDKMTICFTIVCMALILLHRALWRKRKTLDLPLNLYVCVAIAFFLSLAAPVAFGVSTKTSEGDRLLYFPSAWLCILMSVLIFCFIQRAIWQWLLLIVTGIGSIVFIRRNTRNWEVASRTSDLILQTLKRAPERHVIIVNLPDEWEGAFIFRNNFDKAMIMNGVDTSKAVVAHYLLRKEYVKTEGDIAVARKDDGFFFYPVTEIIPGKGQFRVVDLSTGSSQDFSERESAVYYWDKSRLKRLILE
jgi:hypothetical protein